MGGFGGSYSSVLLYGMFRLQILRVERVSVRVFTTIPTEIIISLACRSFSSHIFTEFYDIGGGGVNTNGAFAQLPLISNLEYRRSNT